MTDPRDLLPGVAADWSPIDTGSTWTKRGNVSTCCSTRSPGPERLSSCGSCVDWR